MEPLQRAPKRTTLAPPVSPAPADPAPVRAGGVPRAQRPARTDRLTYRWERLTSAQREAAWSLVERLRTSSAEEAFRRRQRLLFVLLGALIVLLGVLVLILTGAIKPPFPM